MKKNLFLTAVLLLVYALSFGQQWQWLNPRPSGFPNLKIAFTTHQTGFILNGNGDLIRTDDQGGSWNIVGNFPGTHCMDIKYSTGVMAGTQGALYISDDYGATWNSIRSGINDNLSFVNIVSRDSLLITTDNGTTYMTGDRGKTWTTHSYNALLNCITFLNSMIGFAGGTSAGILKTSDGGQTWTTINLNYTPSDITAIDFLNMDTGFAFRDWGTMLITHDGGNTWNSYSVNVAESPTTIDFINPSVGFLAGPGGTLYRSKNGGVSWTMISPPNTFHDGYDIYSLAFLSPDTGIAVGSMGQILKTTDSGQTWTAYSPTYLPVSDVCFPSPATGYAANGSYILKTTDSGRTWNPLGLTTGTTYGNYSAFQYTHFSNPDTGYVISDQYVTVHKTNDGGQTWTTIVPTGYGYQSAPGISYGDAQTALLSLSTAIVATHDGGDTWNTVWTPNGYGPTNFVNRVYYLNPTTAYGLYFNHAYKTTDGCKTWTQLTVPSPFGYDFTGVWFLNDQKGFIVDDESDVFETNDGGTTWKMTRTYTANDEGNFNGIVKFFNSQVGYLTNGNISGPGSYGRIYKTMDGGQTWQLSYPVGGVSIQFTPDSDVVVAGIGGTILRAPVAGWEVDSVSVLSNSACETILSAGVGVALGVIDSIRWEVTAPGGNVRVINTSPGSVQANRIAIASTVDQLTPDSPYSARLKFRYNGITEYSDTLQFIARGLPQPSIYDSVGFMVSNYATGNQWYRNGSTISGATDRIYAPKDSGRYAVQVTQNGCTSHLSQSIKFFPNDMGVLIAPNPTRGQLFLVNTQGRNLAIRIFDMMGRSVPYSISSSYPGSMVLDVSRLAPGEYILNLTDKQSKQTANLLFIKL